MIRWIRGMWHRKRLFTPECVRDWEPRSAAARVLLWVTFVCTTGVLFGEIRHEASVREQQLCVVVINVHSNDEFRLSTDRQNLNQTLDYLRDPSSHETPGLRARVVETLPIIRARIIADERSIQATAVPPVCQKYVALDKFAKKR